ATDVFKLVIGQQDFQRGAVVALLLLAPALLTFGVDRLVAAKQTSALSARAVPYRPKRVPWFDRLMTGYCAFIAFLMLAMLGMAVFASFASFWPYNLAPSLRNYDFDHMDGGGWATYFNSLRMALGTALVGSAVAFAIAWLVDKPRHAGLLRDGLNLVATLPLAVPGLALGLGYILFFNDPANPLRGLYGTMAILIACTVAHFLSVAHLTMVAALRQLDREYELVGESLGVAPWFTAWRVHLPVCLPALLEVAGYFFVNAMTTVSAVVFLYAPHTQLASVAVLNMDDAGDMAPAAAMAVLIFVTAGAARLLFALASRWLLARTQRWRQR
ncbi:MAG: ABC transporter permease subunit, partial [Rubrivivax sp.]|nr:ABC transporter permease subunit [Rubrivivax sp.]